jgi:hypothetical protein
MAVRLNYRIHLFVLLLVMVAADIVLGRYIPDPTEHHQRFKREIEDVILHNFFAWRVSFFCTIAYLAM